MGTSDWIAISSMVTSVIITTIGSALYLSFRIGSSNEKIVSMATSVDKLDKTLTLVQSDVGEIRVEMAEMKVKVDKLWRDYADRRRF